MSHDATVKTISMHRPQFNDRPDGLKSTAFSLWEYLHLHFLPDEGEERGDLECEMQRLALPQDTELMRLTHPAPAGSFHSGIGWRLGRLSCVAMRRVSC